MAAPTYTVQNNPNPADRHAAITPSDVTVLSPLPRALKVTASGNLALEDADGTAITYVVSVGEVIQFRPTRVKATGTTATVVAWY